MVPRGCDDSRCADVNIKLLVRCVRDAGSAISAPVFNNGWLNRFSCGSLQYGGRVRITPTIKSGLLLSITLQIMSRLLRGSFFTRHFAVARHLQQDNTEQLAQKVVSITASISQIPD